MGDSIEWVNFETFTELASAEFLAGLLQSEGVRAKATSNLPIAGLELGFGVSVAAEDLRRARLILDTLPDIDEAELIYLATGERPDPLGEDAPGDFVEGADPAGFSNTADPAAHERRRRRRKRRRD